MPNLPAYTIAAKLQKLALQLFVAFILVFCQPVTAQPPVKASLAAIADSNSIKAPLADTGDIITSFEDLNMPPEMLAHFRQITPDEITTLHEELQVTQNNEDGIAIVITLHLHFNNNYLVGTIQEAPLEKTSMVTISKFSVNIPVEWICRPANKKHGQHYVSSIDATKLAADKYKCSGWHIKFNDEVVKEHPAYQRTKKKSKRTAAT